MGWGNKFPDMKNDPSYLEPRVTANETQLAQIQSQAISVNTTFHADGSITEVYGNGVTKTTTFNPDGSISEVLTGAINKTKTTTFNADGSISEVVV